MNDFIFFILRDAFWSALAALGFAILFNVPVRTLFGCALTGAIGHVLRTVVIHFGGSIEAGSLLGATVVGILGHLFARRWRVPNSTFTVRGVIPMVPGGLAFGALLGFINGASLGVEAGTPLLLKALIDVIKTSLILLGLAFGIALPNLWLNRQKPVV